MTSKKQLDWNRATFALAEAALGQALCHLGELKEVDLVEVLERDIQSTKVRLNKTRHTYLKGLLNEGR